MSFQQPTSWRLLLVDDDRDDYLLFKDYLDQAQGKDSILDWAESYHAGEQCLNSARYDAVFVDYHLGPASGIQFIRETIARGYPAPLILLTGQGSYKVDLEAMDAGATFYLTKDEINALSLERFTRYAIERKRCEDALAASEAKYRGLSESIQDGLIEVDRNWRFKYLNQRAAMIAGYPQEELVGRVVWDIFPYLTGTLVDNYCRQVMQRREPANFEMAGTRSDKWYIIRIYPSTEGISVLWIDVTESKRAEQELREQTMQIELHHHLLEHREQERQRIARELHDGPIQDLLALLMSIRYKQDMIADVEAKKEFEKIEDGLNRAIQNMRDMINEIRPPHLVRLGMAKAIQIYLDDFQCKHPEIELRANLMEERVNLTEPERIGLFRILQEAVTNAVKHSHSKRLQVNWLQKNHQAILEVQDDGKGFQVPESLLEYSSCGHYGLVGMSERAEAIGGQFIIHSAPGKGTTAQVVVPLLD